MWKTNKQLKTTMVMMELSPKVVYVARRLRWINALFAKRWAKIFAPGLFASAIQRVIALQFTYLSYYLLLLGMSVNSHRCFWIFEKIDWNYTCFWLPIYLQDRETFFKTLLDPSKKIFSKDYLLLFIVKWFY